MPPRGWTKPRSYKYRILSLRREYPELSYADIAATVGCSFDTVRSECGRAGLAIGRLPKDYAPMGAEICQLREQNLKWPEIAAILGVDRGTVWRARKIVGLPIRGVDHARHA